MRQSNLSISNELLVINLGEDASTKLLWLKKSSFTTIYSCFDPAAEAGMQLMILCGIRRDYGKQDALQ